MVCFMSKEFKIDIYYSSVGSLEPQFRMALWEGIGRAELIKLSFSQQPEHIVE